jgi:hypothetical protein
LEVVLTYRGNQGATGTGWVIVSNGDGIQIASGLMRDRSVPVSLGIHQTFQLPLEPGLTEVLSDKCQLEAAIRVTMDECVDVLPAGALQCNPHSLVTSAHWERFLKQIPADYRYVIVDTPPNVAPIISIAAQSADAATLARVEIADGFRIDYGRERLLHAQVINLVGPHGKLHQRHLSFPFLKFQFGWRGPSSD